MNSAVHLAVLTSVFELGFVLTGAVGLRAAEAAAPARPVFLYSRYFNAGGETRHLPDGTYQDVLRRLQPQFEVRVNREPLAETSLAGVKVVLIANPITPGTCWSWPAIIPPDRGRS